MNLNLLDEESIQPSEPTPCDFFKGENAIKKAKQLGLPDLELVRNAIMIGDADYRTNTHYNRARFIARWGKIGEQIALLLRQSDPAWIFHNDSQPRIENTVKKISVHDKFHRTLILSGFCLLKIAKISLNSSFFPKPIKR